MNAYKEMMKGIEWVFENRTAYRVAKDINVNARTINRYQNGTSPIGNMTFETAGKIYNYYKELEIMNINGVEVRNVDELERFLDERLKSDFVLEEYIKEIIEAARQERIYELSSHETKSGNPVDVHFKYEFEYDEDLDETKNEVITIL